MMFYFLAAVHYTLYLLIVILLHIIDNDHIPGNMSSSTTFVFFLTYTKHFTSWPQLAWLLGPSLSFSNKNTFYAILEQISKSQKAEMTGNIV